VDRVEIFLCLEGVIDFGEEKKRLQKEFDKVSKDIEFISKKLSNEKFISRAPKEIVEKEKEETLDFDDRDIDFDEAIEANRDNWRNEVRRDTSRDCQLIIDHNVYPAALQNFSQGATVNPQRGYGEPQHVSFSLSVDVQTNVEIGTFLDKQCVFYNGYDEGSGEFTKEYTLYIGEVSIEMSNHLNNNVALSGKIVPESEPEQEL